MRIYILKADTHAMARLGIEHCAVGLEVASFGMGFEEDLGANGARVGHFDIATVETQFREAGGNAGGRALLKNLGCCREGKPGSSSPLVFHECLRVTVVRILSLVGHLRGQKNAQNEAKVGEKVRCGREGVAPKRFCSNKRTYVLL